MAASAMRRRSRCPVACSLDLLGDRWTLLVIRDLTQGGSRFKHFTAAAEGVPTNILAERLNRLVHHGVVEQVPAAPGAKRQAYRLTPKGEALRPVLAALHEWGMQWEAPAFEVPPAQPLTS